MKTESFISIVVYVFNDEELIYDFLHKLKNVLEKSFENYEIICVNDNSSDDSVKKIKAFADEQDNLSLALINMGGFQGMESSISAGLDMAIGDFVYEFDRVDINIDFDYVEKIYSRSLEGYDIVCAAPKTAKSTSRIFYSIYNKFSYNKPSGESHKLTTESFRILSRRAVNRVSSMSNQVLYRKALYSSCGLAIDTLVYKRRKEEGALKKHKELRKDNYNTAIDSLLLFTKVGYSISLFLCIVMALFAFGVGIYTVIIYFGHNKPVEGWAPIMGFMAAGFLGVFMILTIVIKYLDLMLKLIFKRQKYLIKSVDKIK